MKNPMTVAELREKLATYPDDAFVFGTWEGQVEPVRGITLYERWYDLRDAVVLDVDKP